MHLFKYTICTLNNQTIQIAIYKLNRLHLLRLLLKSKLTISNKLTIYSSIIRPVWIYGIQLEFTKLYYFKIHSNVNYYITPLIKQSSSILLPDNIID
ncbi:putative RNA-directed DNA polymerase, partial [Aphis craccivora]